MTTLPAPYFGTESVCGQNAVTSEERVGRCYELAAYALALGDAPTDATLVHGSMQARLPGAPRIDHAWLELKSGLVWEPAGHDLWPARVWEAFARPHPLRHYTRARVRELVLEHKHWGPWPNGD